MKFVAISILICLLAGCGGMVPVEGVPEMQILHNKKATVTVQPDGSRLVTVTSGEVVTVIIMMPPLPTKPVPVTVPTVDKVEK